MNMAISESTVRPEFLAYIIRVEEEDEDEVERFEKLKEEQREMMERLKKEREREKTART